MESQITYGSVYQTIGDVPDEGGAYILPLEDVKDETYVWITPECEVEVPGTPLYRFACDRSQLTEDFGFKTTASFSASGVIAISACSDWTEYAKRREEGGWEQEKAAILASASASATNGDQTSSTGTAPTPTANASSTPASPLSAYNDLSTLSSTPCYLAFNASGDWLSGNPTWIVTGFSGGKMTLTAVEATTDDLPSNAFPFRVTSSTNPMGDIAIDFTIQNAETGEYLAWNSTDGFSWAQAEGADTKFSTSDAYNGDGFEMNISYDTPSLTASGMAYGTYASQGWTYWIAKA